MSKLHEELTRLFNLSNPVELYPELMRRLAACNITSLEELITATMRVDSTSVFTAQSVMGAIRMIEQCSDEPISGSTMIREQRDLAELGPHICAIANDRPSPLFAGYARTGLLIRPTGSGCRRVATEIALQHYREYGGRVPSYGPIKGYRWVTPTGVDELDLGAVLHRGIEG